MKKVAIPLKNNSLSAHFGHADVYVVFGFENGAVIDKSYEVPPPHAPGVIPRWLSEHKVDLVIAGGIGQRAIEFFNRAGINVIIGASETDPEKIIKSYIDGNLESGMNLCDH